MSACLKNEKNQQTQNQLKQTRQKKGAAEKNDRQGA
jgi:hypothetical protein